MVVWGYLDGRRYRPVYDMAGGGDGVRMSDLVRGEVHVLELRHWAHALDLSESTVRRRLTRNMTIIDALDRRPWQHGWDNGLRFHVDSEAKSFVADHPGGAQLQEVAEFFGIDPRTVRLIEFQALTEAEANLPPEMREAWVAALRARHEDV